MSKKTPHPRLGSIFSRQIYRSLFPFPFIISVNSVRTLLRCLWGPQSTVSISELWWKCKSHLFLLWTVQTALHISQRGPPPFQRLSTTGSIIFRTCYTSVMIYTLFDHRGKKKIANTTRSHHFFSGWLGNESVCQQTAYSAHISVELNRRFLMNQLVYLLELDTYSGKLASSLVQDYFSSLAMSRSIFSSYLFFTRLVILMRIMHQVLSPCCFSDNSSSKAPDLNFQLKNSSGSVPGGRDMLQCKSRIPKNLENDTTVFSWFLF